MGICVKLKSVGLEKCVEGTFHPAALSSWGQGDLVEKICSEENISAACLQSYLNTIIIWEGKTNGSI